MRDQEEKSICCPYCGETIDILIDASLSEQEYIEDCQVCCCPMNISVSIEDKDIAVNVSHENE